MRYIGLITATPPVRARRSGALLLGRVAWIVLVYFGARGRDRRRLGPARDPGQAGALRSPS